MSSMGAKKAVHVKWAGKTIALGTFQIAEADEKCARAKALTRAWRSTMRPKPTREWVMLELERLNVRVVSGRSGVKEEEFGGDDGQQGMPGMPSHGGGMDPNMFGNQGMGVKKEQGEGMPPHRPLVGGGSAAAYEAARAEHYRELEERKKKGQGSQGKEPGPGSAGNGAGAVVHQGMPSSMPTSMNNSLAMRNPSFNEGGMPGGGSNIPSGLGGLSINANQHYEMLKLHHMNLLNEIQETTLMMNIYQQQQLQQQQQQQQIQEQQRRNSGAFGSHNQNNNSDNSSNGGMGQYGSMSSNMNKNRGNTLGEQQEVLSKEAPNGNGASENNDGGESREDKLAKIKAEIEERKRMLEELAGGGGDMSSDHGNKRPKAAV